MSSVQDRVCFPNPKIKNLETVPAVASLWTEGGREVIHSPEIRYGTCQLKPAKIHELISLLFFGGGGEGTTARCVVVFFVPLYGFGLARFH